MLGFWIDTESNEGKVVETSGNLKDLYKMCRCDCIDIAVIDVCGVAFDFIVDDEGLLKDNPKASVFDSNGKAMLVGDVVVLKSDDEGDFVGLTESDIDILRSRTGIALLASSHDVREGIVLIAD